MLDVCIGLYVMIIDTVECGEEGRFCEHQLFEVLFILLSFDFIIWRGNEILNTITNVYKNIFFKIKSFF